MLGRSSTVGLHARLFTLADDTAMIGVEIVDDIGRRRPSRESTRARTAGDGWTPDGRQIEATAADGSMK